jgi:hypothetical protein
LEQVALQAQTEAHQPSVHKPSARQYPRRRLVVVVAVQQAWQDQVVVLVVTLLQQRLLLSLLVKVTTVAETLEQSTHLVAVQAAAAVQVA